MTDFTGKRRSDPPAEARRSAEVQRGADATGPPSPEQVADIQAMAKGFAHDAAVTANWEAFHVDVPTDSGWYVCRYRDCSGGLLYVSMTGKALGQAEMLWRKADWRSWVMSAEYVRCQSRDEAYRLKAKIQHEEEPLFPLITGCAAMIKEIDSRHHINHVTGDCYCNRPELISQMMAGADV